MSWPVYDFQPGMPSEEYRVNTQPSAAFWGGDGEGAGAIEAEGGDRDNFHRAPRGRTPPMPELDDPTLALSKFTDSWC